MLCMRGLVTKPRLKPPRTDLAVGTRTFVARAAAVRPPKTASKASPLKTWFISPDPGFRRCLGALLALTMACGGGNPTEPSGASGSGTPNFGTLTAIIDGVAYTGVINTATNTNGVLRISSNSTDLTRSVNVAARTGMGTITVSPASEITFNVITTTGTTVIGSWGAAGQSGSGTLTVTSLTSSGATGTFSFNAPPAPAPSAGQATGTKVVTNGSFTARF